MVLSAATLDSDAQALAIVSQALRSEHASYAASLIRASLGFSLTTLAVIGVMLALAVV